MKEVGANGEQLPFNNQCNANQKTGTALGLFGLSIDAPGMPMQHVKATLPPSLYFPGEAEIRYYIKVTVNRPGLLRENPRVFANLNFVPIEPPRPTTDGEMYARRQHSFKQDHYNPPSWERKNSGGLKGLFRKDSSTPTTPIPSPVSPATPSASPEPARFTIDARLPNPAVLTCGEDVPLRVIIKPLSEWNESLYLQTVHIELIGYTKVRAEDAVRVETHSWVIMSSANINQTIGNPSDAVDTEIEIPKKYWEGRPLPNTVAPSFVTCNIQRWYELVVSVGLTYGSNKERVCPYLPFLKFPLTLFQHQFISLPLRTKVEVYSGIRPPDALLKRMATAPPRPGSPTRPQRIPAPSQRPPRPVAAPAASVSSSAAAAAAQQEEPPPSYEDAPPSYEDAIASDLPPIDGPRPDYAPPPAPLGESTLGEKR